MSSLDTFTITGQLLVLLILDTEDDCHVLYFVILNHVIIFYKAMLLSW